MMKWHEQDQLRGKRQEVERLLGRSVDHVHHSPRSLAYRARVTMKVNPDGRLGYHRPRSHQWTHVPSCAIAREELNAVLEKLPGLPPQLSEVELRSDGKNVVLAARSNKLRGRRDRSRAARKKSRQALKALDIKALGLAGITLDGEKLSGETRLQLLVGGIAHEVSADSFYQVNLEANELLVARVSELIGALQPTSLLDLYAGIGNLSLPIAANGIDTVLIEQSKASAGDAERSLRRHGLKARIIRGDAGRFQAGDLFFDVALLDPPRAGAPGLLTELITTRPRAIFYVSCNPSTLARDLSSAAAAGYTISALELFDMFPQTEHIETLCRLSPT
ncbi:MAG: hypothetical protein CMP23_01180 [Rickettsiales bacterium]|nr:hypothetical protein [Rickettsiales bacterium]